MTALSMTTSPIDRSTLASIITERLSDSIVNGVLAPGSQLSVVELATRFGVSRGPVRQAVQRLIHEGLLRSEPHRGVFVPVLSEEDVRDLYLTREALEAAAVQHIIHTSKSAQAADELDRLVGLMQEAETVCDWDAVSRYDWEFHSALVAASGSERLQRMFSTVISETRLCLGVLTAADARSDLVGEHRKIAATIREGRTEDALEVLKKHFVDALGTITRRSEQTPEEETA